jgi:hypothetical protein
MRRSGVLVEWSCEGDDACERESLSLLSFFLGSGSIFWGISLRGFSVGIICFRRLIFGLLSLNFFWESLVRQTESLGFRRTGFVEEMREETRVGFLFLAKFFPHRLTRIYTIRFRRRWVIFLMHVLVSNEREISVFRFSGQNAVRTLTTE